MCEADFLSTVRSALEKSCPDVDAFVYDSIDSTSSEAKRYAREGGKPAVFIAREQTAGRGRLGRSFLSSEGGLYFSYLFYPDIKPCDAVMITVYAAVCLSEIIEQITSLKVSIKWVNDLMVDGKKLAGILTEGAFSENADRFKYAVVGIGLNVGRVHFPSELADIATDIESESGLLPDISDIAVRLTKRLGEFKNKSPLDYMDGYRMRSVVVGKRVRVERGGESYFATALAIGDDASLTVLTDDGIEKKLSSGEVSIRL